MLRILQCCRLVSWNRNGWDFAWSKSADLVHFRTSYALDMVRNSVLKEAWYGPSPFLEASLLTEFEHIDEETPHFLQITGTAGLRFRPRLWFVFQVGGGVRSEVLEPDPAVEPGINIRAVLEHRRYFGRPHSPIYAGASADYFVSWRGSIPIQKLTIDAQLDVVLLGPLRLSFALGLFVYDEASTPTAVALEGSLGLGILLGHRSQSF